ncbi:MAG: hypothetical protein AAF788_04845, partial [Pseudomonadota bacterium]
MQAFQVLWRRSRVYTLTGFMLLVSVPVLFVLLALDPRTVDGINVWLKPIKFHVSLGLYALTLAYFRGWMSGPARGSWFQRAVTMAFVIAIVFESLWLICASALGVRAHFNVDGGLYTAL